ncbi:hypothetical protein BDW72DRAFT_198375 [Aspergillus terricola var. indicus]
MREPTAFPPEIRRIIWNLCLPSRIYELEAPIYDKIKTRCRLWWTSTANWSPPILAWVCRESRSIASEHVEMEEYEDKNFRSRWLNRTVDTPLQCWDPCDTEGLWSSQIPMTGELEWYSEQCQGRARIYADCVLEFYPEGPWDEGDNPGLDSLKRNQQLCSHGGCCGDSYDAGTRGLTGSFRSPID